MTATSTAGTCSEARELPFFPPVHNFTTKPETEGLSDDFRPPHSQQFTILGCLDSHSTPAENHAGQHYIENTRHVVFRLNAKNLASSTS
jgi:hypothetical protein